MGVGGEQVPQLLSYLQLISLLFASSSHHSLPSRNIGSPAGSPPSHIHLPTINQHLASPPVIPTPTHPSLFTLVAPKRHFARKSGLITQTTPSPRTLGLFFPWKELDKGMGRGWIWDGSVQNIFPSYLPSALDILNKGVSLFLLTPTKRFTFLVILFLTAFTRLFIQQRSPISGKQQEKHPRPGHSQSRGVKLQQGNT